MSFLADFWEKLKKGDYRAIDIALTAALTLGATISTGISIYEVYLKRQAQAAAREAASSGPKRGRPLPESLLALHGLRPEQLQFLDVHEGLMLTCLVPPGQLALASGEVYGVDVVLDDLKRKLLRPVQLRDWYSRGLWRLPKGVLLYGPSGTGKTSLAKVIAKAGQFRFLHLSAAAISDKWIGEGPKRVRAAFSLAHRVAPCIIFVDEVDTLLSRRTDANQPGGHEAYDQVKTEFMSQWDGLLSEAAQLSGVVVMGATNRRQALDPAVLRRFTLQYEVPAPGLPQRRAILLGYLRRHVGPVEHDLLPPGLMAAEARAALRRRQRQQQKQALQQQQQQQQLMAGAGAEAAVAAEAEAEAAREEGAGRVEQGEVSSGAASSSVSASASDASCDGPDPSSDISTSDVECGGAAGRRGRSSGAGDDASTSTNTTDASRDAPTDPQKRNIGGNTSSTSSSTSGGGLIKGPQKKARVDSPAAGQTAAAEAAAPATTVTADNEPGTEPDVGAEGEAGLLQDAADDHNDDDDMGADSDGGSDDTVDAPGLDWLAAATEGLTGAHLRELCHRAALLVLDEVPEEQLKSLHPDRGGAEVLRPLCRHDFEVALRLQSGAPLAG